MRIYVWKLKEEVALDNYLGFSIDKANLCYLKFKAERKRQAQTVHHQSQAPAPPKAPLVSSSTISNGSGAQAYPNRSITASTTTITSSSSTLKKNNKKDKNKKLTKADIGLPSDFKHVSHVGWVSYRN